MSITGVGVGTPFARRQGGWTTLTDGTTTIRKVVRSNYLCIDITITATGFSGTEGVDWENIISYAL
jgi:hypothetical protein